MCFYILFKHFYFPNIHEFFDANFRSSSFSRNEKFMALSIYFFLFLRHIKNILIKIENIEIHKCKVNYLQYEFAHITYKVHYTRTHLVAVLNKRWGREMKISSQHLALGTNIIYIKKGKGGGAIHLFPPS